MTVYFARRRNLIKIGFSENVPQRIAALSQADASAPLDYLGSIPGDRELEKHFHQRFQADREFGEWFKATDELLLLIATMCTKDMPPRPRTMSGVELFRGKEDVFCEEAAEALEAFMRAGDKDSALSDISSAYGIPETRLQEILKGSATYVTSGEYAVLRALGEVSGYAPRQSDEERAKRFIKDLVTEMGE